MAYTTNQALTALNSYLGITDQDKEIIPETKNRGFVYTLNSGEKVVIFVYPLVHKQDNTKNYFDTRDSGAYERGVAWNYAIANNLKYFCLGINDSVDKFADYAFSLECNEHVIETISGTRNGSRNGPGNQIIIPNNYIPQQPFERIRNRLGTYISAIRKERLHNYLTTYDNRPYMIDATEVQLGEKEALQEYKSLDLDGRKQAFITWMKSKSKSGAPSPVNDNDYYSESVVYNYANFLVNRAERLEEFPYEHTNLYYYVDPAEFAEVQKAILRDPKYPEVNQKCISKGFGPSMDRYKEFLESLQSGEMEETGEESEMDNDNKLKTCLEVSRDPRENALHPLNFIVYGAPGTGKTYSTAEYALAIIENRPVDTTRKTAEERKEVMKKYNDLISKGQVVFTTFHQSYGYEEFIQGLRPDTKAGNMAFKTVDGVFKHIADIALNDGENNYVIIIDEINRANISKVFGELITLIEEDKRWGEVNETCATLQSGDVFAVPNNLYIVGTMNSADKSISLIDAALRRRFEFIEQHPDATLVDDAVLRGVMKKLNEQLADALESSDLLIGHSYFMGKNKASLCTIMNNSIIPLLYEYFYDNKKKVISVLEECLKGLDVKVKDDKISRVYVVKAQAEADA